MKAKTSSAVIVSLALGALFTATACGPRNVSFFGTPPPVYVSRQEVADQGSGTSMSPEYRSTRVTVGGSYLRRLDASSPNFRVDAGLHGNPDAFR